jgi:DNA-binding beta-propeller fold protein YncE
MALGKDKRLFIADTGNNRIRAVDLAGGTITTVAGNGEPRNFGDGGRAINASLSGPTAVALDLNGNLYIADAGNNCIRRVDVKTQTITTWETAHDLASFVNQLRIRLRPRTKRITEIAWLQNLGAIQPWQSRATGWYHVQNEPKISNGARLPLHH